MKTCCFLNLTNHSVSERSGAARARSGTLGHPQVLGHCSGSARASARASLGHARARSGAFGVIKNQGLLVFTTKTFKHFFIKSFFFS